MFSYSPMAKIILFWPKGTMAQWPPKHGTVLGHAQAFGPKSSVGYPRS